MNTITLTLNPHDRLTLATTIERLINMLDDLEPDADLEPVNGWSETAGAGIIEAQATDDREGDDERDVDLAGALDDREEECEDEGAQCDDEGEPDYGIADYPALQAAFY